jgi:hypothetical protein
MQTLFLRPARWLLLAITVGLLTTRCATTKVITEYDCADAFPLNKDTTVWHYFWGLKQARDIRPTCDPSFNYLNRVEVKTTVGQVLLSFLTLGIVLPQKISWCCAPYNPTPGSPGRSPQR